MPVYQTPGVYVEEIPGTPPIVGVGTSTAAIIGEVANSATMPDKPDGSGKYVKAPVNEPRLVTNWLQFVVQFGEIQGGNKLLALAVNGFFLNGGTRCYVVRTEDMTVESIKESLRMLEKIDEIAIVCAPGAVDAMAKELIAHCEKMEDRFAIVDGHQHDDPALSPGVDDIKGTVLSNNTYAGLYFPWLKISDPLEDPGELYSMPPSAHMAGIFSRVDAQRGVHKAPANEVVRGIVDLDYRMNHNEQGSLNDAGINIIRSFSSGIKVWGARTLGGKDNGEFKYVSVRRLINFLKESIDEGTQFAVFEPNAQPLWQKIKRSVNGFLTNVWRDGALFGATPEEAFFVKCDESTNPPEVRVLGQVIIEIGVAVVQPAEFVIFRISQITGAGA